MLMAACGCCIEIKLVAASTGYIFTLFIVMSGWFLLASAIVQYQRKIKLLNKYKRKVLVFKNAITTVIKTTELKLVMCERWLCD